jgi:hypothetical protein
MNNLLPMGELELLSDSWCGHSNPGAKSGVVMAYLIRNVSYPGFMDYSVNTIKDSLIHESKKPAVPLFGCPYPISLLAHILGGQTKEFELHRKFSKYRVRKNGEWFHHTGKLAEFISEIAMEELA